MGFGVPISDNLVIIHMYKVRLQGRTSGTLKAACRMCHKHYSFVEKWQSRSAALNFLRYITCNICTFFVRSHPSHVVTHLGSWQS